MRKKLLSKTYLRDVDKYRLKIWFDNDDYYIASKRIEYMEKPFIISSGKCLMNNGYSIIEVVPKYENYSMRVYLDDQNNVLQYYFDVSLENGVDSETKIPFYDDLYLDVTITDGKVTVLDEDELVEALNSETISIDAYNLAVKVKEKLLSEIKNGTNKYLNINLTDYLI